MKKLIALVFVMVLAFTPPAASGAPKTKTEVEAALTNFSMSLVFDAQGQETYYFRQVSNDKGTFFETKSSYHDITYLDFVKKTGYKLDADEKSGESFPLEPVGRYKGFALYMTNHLFMHLHYKNEMVKSGSEKILGRDATVYTVTSNAEMKLWIDDEYGFTLKYEQTGSIPMTAYVTEFTVGGAVVEGMVNLDEYKLE